MKHDLIILAIFIYSICSFIGLLANAIWIMDSKYHLNDGEWKLTPFSLIFPIWLLPFLFKTFFTYDLKTIKFFKKKELCQCNKCGTAHETYFDKVNKALNLK